MRAPSTEETFDIYREHPAITVEDAARIACPGISGCDLAHLVLILRNQTFQMRKQGRIETVGQVLGDRGQHRNLYRVAVDGPEHGAADFGRYSVRAAHHDSAFFFSLSGPVMNSGAYTGTWVVPAEMQKDMAKTLRFILDRLEAGQ